jgi:hypothetical protein
MGVAMNEDEKQVIKDVINDSFKEILQSHLQDFYISREQHYKDHTFIESLMKWTENSKSVVNKTIIKFVVSAIITAILLGFSVKMGILEYFKKGPIG